MQSKPMSILALFGLAMATSHSLSQPPLNDCEQLAALLINLETMRQRYTKQHPEVMKLESQIKELTGRLETSAPGASIEQICPGIGDAND